jgi:hypothetical protein
MTGTISSARVCSKDRGHQSKPAIDTLTMLIECDRFAAGSTERQCSSFCFTSPQDPMEVASLTRRCPA